MTLMNIPLQPIPNQSVSFVLNDESYTIDVETRLENIYITIFRAGAYVLRNRALRAYAPVGFDLQLADTLGTDDPVYAGLGSRWLLMGLQQ
jgi:hypothetical protein